MRREGATSFGPEDSEGQGQGQGQGAGKGRKGRRIMLLVVIDDPSSTCLFPRARAPQRYVQIDMHSAKRSLSAADQEAPETPKGRR